MEVKDKMPIKSKMHLQLFGADGQLKEERKCTDETPVTRRVNINVKNKEQV
jgi:hypothetical protein